MRRIASLAAIAVLALAGPVLAQKPDAAVEGLTRQYEQAFNKGDAKALAALYAEEAMELAPDGLLLVGRESIEQGFARAFAGMAKGATLTLKPGRTQEVTPDVRLSEGTYQTTGGSRPGRGRYVNTLVRQGGQWRLAGVVVVPDSRQEPGSTGAKPATGVSK